MSTKLLTNIDCGNTTRLTNVPTPVSAGDVVPKSYVDAGGNGTIFGIYTTQSGNYTITTSDQTVTYTGTGGNTFTFPIGSSCLGQVFDICHIGLGNLTLSFVSGDTAQGNSSIILYSKESLTFQSIGSSLWIIK